MHGRQVTLVDPDSATCGFTETNPPATFPIGESHSNMIKYEKGSQTYDVVISKLLTILAAVESEANFYHGSNGSSANDDSRPNLLLTANLREITGQKF